MVAEEGEWTGRKRMYICTLLEEDIVVYVLGAEA